MQLRLAAGDRAGALAAYEACRALLERELGVSPSPETEALAERLRRATLLEAEPVRERVVGLTPTEATDVPLVGRTDEFMRLVDLYRAACHGQPHLVMVQGEPGIGKTRLAHEFLGWANGHGADVLQGRAFETGGRLPYQPLVDALRPRLERENAPEDLLSDVWLVELARLLPELRDRYPDLPVPAGDEAAARARLLEAVARLGQALARRGPVVLFVDDVQWADAGSLDMLRYAARRWTQDRAPLLVLLSVRSEAVATLPELGDWLMGIRRDLASAQIELGPLSYDDTLALVQRFAIAAQRSESGRPPAPELEQFARWLFDETSGQPLFAVETIRALLERGALVPGSLHEGGWTTGVQAGLADAGSGRPVLAPGVRDVIGARLARLARASRDVLAAGAVLGQGFTFEQICRVAGLAEDDALPAVDEVLRAQLLREVNAGDHAPAASYIFSHDRIRDVVYVQAGDARRRVYHRRALDALQGNGSAAQLARHALAAGLEERAARLGLVAGDEAMRVLAARDAISHYERAMGVAERLGLHTVLTNLRARRGKALASMGHWTEARRDLEAALDRLSKDQREVRAELLVDLLEAYWWLLDMPSLRRAADEVQALAEGLGRGDLETAAVGWLAGAIGADGDVPGVVDQCRRALARGRELGIPVPPQVHTYISLSFYWLGQLDEAVERSGEGVEAARAANHTSALMWCLPHLGLARAARGEYDRAMQAFEEAHRFGREHAVTTLLARAVAMSAGFHLDVFDFAGNETLAEETRELARSFNFLPPAVSAGIDLLLNYARQHQIAQAERLIDEVAASAEGTAGFHGWLWRLRLAEARAEIALARSEPDEALTWADRAVQASRERRRAKYHVIGIGTRGRALLALGREAEALEDLKAAVGLARPVGDPALFFRAAAGLLAVDGDDALAAEAGAAVDRIAAALPDAQMLCRFEAAEAVRLVRSLRP